MILDTNAVSALAERDPAVIHIVSSAPSPRLSFISVAEFEFGILGSSRPDPAKAFIDGLSAVLRVLFPSPETIGHYAWIADHLKRTGRPIPHNDMWTAALARQFELPILSRDRHFDYVGGIIRIGW